MMSSLAYNLSEPQKMLLAMIARSENGRASHLRAVVDSAAKKGLVTKLGPMCAELTDLGRSVLAEVSR